MQALLFWNRFRELFDSEPHMEMELNIVLLEVKDQGCKEPWKSSASASLAVPQSTEVSGSVFFLTQEMPALLQVT